MAKRLTKWKPDTCGCILVYEWDEADVQAPAVIKQVLEACDIHKGFATPAEHFTAIQSQNKAKNKILGLIVDNFPKLTKEVDNGNGETISVVDDGVFSYSYDETGKISVDIKGLTVQEKSDFDQTLKTEIGTDKVEII